MNFLGYPEKIPDRNTIWYFCERLSNTGNDHVYSMGQEMQDHGKTDKDKEENYAGCFIHWIRSWIIWKILGRWCKDPQIQRFLISNKKIMISTSSTGRTHLWMRSRLFRNQERYLVEVNVLGKPLISLFINYFNLVGLPNIYLNAVEQPYIYWGG